MERIAIVYGTTEGHTRKICNQVAGWLAEAGHQVQMLDSDDLPSELELASSDRFILAGSLHEGQHQKTLVIFVKAHRNLLASKPSLFLSVSLSAIRKDDKHQADAQRCINQFCADTNWHPSRALPVAGALLYTQYSWMKRTLMRMISEKEGGDVDTSRDYEYTDWAELREEVEDFCETSRPLTSASGRA